MHCCDGYKVLPAVSRISSNAGSSSIVTCLRYVSSIVGSYSSKKLSVTNRIVNADFWIKTNFVK